jgi:hypothetical protein
MVWKSDGGDGSPGFCKLLPGSRNLLSVLKPLSL